MEKRIQIIICILKIKGEEYYLRLLKEKSNYTILGFNELKTIEEIVDVLWCFIEDNTKLIFSCVDVDAFLNNLHNEDKKIQDFHNKLVEFNKKKNGESILKEGKDEEEKRKFINERVIFVNNESDFPINIPSVTKRQNIWYKTINREDVFKAISIDNLFKCIVLKEGNNFFDFQYALAHYETESGSNLYIVEKQEGNFEEYVYPRLLEKYIKNFQD